MEDRYIILRDDWVDELLKRVNTLCAIPVTDEGWATGAKPKYDLISLFGQSTFYVAVLEKN